jgi:trans-aconitate methyltransferase
MDKETGWNPEAYAKGARFVAELGEPLVALLKPRQGETILDLGCGDGALTERILLSGARVIGVDSSPAQVEAAKKKHIEVAVMNGHQPCFKPFFDAVFTNAALHWMRQPEKVARGVYQCLKSRGRFVGEFGGYGNVKTVRQALHAALRRRALDPTAVDPWYYPSVAEYTAVLKRSGFHVQSIELIPRPTKLPGDVREWLELFAQPFMNAIDRNERESLIDEVCRQIASKLCDSAGAWTMDYVRLRFLGSKTSGSGGP